jgi:hypothetical protein
VVCVGLAIRVLMKSSALCRPLSLQGTVIALSNVVGVHTARRESGAIRALGGAWRVGYDVSGFGRRIRSRSCLV